jgi:hypothetical protein
VAQPFEAGPGLRQDDNSKVVAFEVPAEYFIVERPHLRCDVTVPDSSAASSPVKNSSNRRHLRCDVTVPDSAPLSAEPP